MIVPTTVFITSLADARTFRAAQSLPCKTTQISGAAARRVDEPEPSHSRAVHQQPAPQGCETENCFLKRKVSTSDVHATPLPAQPFWRFATTGLIRPRWGRNCFLRPPALYPFTGPPVVASADATSRHHRIAAEQRRRDSARYGAEPVVWGV